MSVRAKRIWSAVSFTVILIALLHIASLVLMPKYVSVTREGNLIGDYYYECDLERQHQVLFVGDCEVYEGICPPVLWQDYGITSYVRGSPQQLIWQSYYLIREMLEYENPCVVVLNVLGMKYGEGQNEAYNRMTLDGMRLSTHKLMSVRESMTGRESTLSYIFPLLRFHSRWTELGVDDFRYIFSRPKVSHNGYLMKKGVVAEENDNIEGENLADYTLPEKCFDYLYKTVELCRSKNVRLVLIKSPTNSWRYWWYDEWDEQISDFAKTHGIDYYNLIGNGEIGLDMSCDSYDGGVHLNVYGAEKTTRYIGKILRDKYAVPDLRESNDIRKIWDEKFDEYIYKRDQD